MSDAQQSNVKKHFFVTYVLWFEHSTELAILPIESRDIQSAIDQADNRALCFRFHEEHETTQTVDGEKIVEIGPAQNYSGWHFINGEVLDGHGLEKAGLVDTQPGRIVKTRYGTTGPFRQGRDKIVYL